MIANHWNETSSDKCNVTVNTNDEHQIKVKFGGALNEVNIYLTKKEAEALCDKIGFALQELNRSENMEWKIAEVSNATNPVTH